MYAPPWISAGQTKLDDVGAGIIAAAAKGAEINQKRAALETELSKLDLAIHNQDSLNSYRNQELELRKRAIDSQAGARTSAIEDRERKLDRYDDQMKEYSSLASEASGLDLDDPDAPNQWWQLSAKYPMGADTRQGVKVGQQFFSSYNSNASKKAAGLATEYNTWAKNTQNNIFSGYKGDFGLLMDEGMWTPQYEGKVNGAKVYGGPEMLQKETAPGVPQENYDPNAKPTGNVFVDTGAVDQSGKKVFITKPRKMIQDTIEKWNDFQGRVNKLPRQQTVPGYGVYPDTHPTQFNRNSQGKVRVRNLQTGKTGVVDAARAQDAVESGQFELVQ